MKMKPIYTFILTQIFFAAIAWLSGFNFDERSLLAAYLTVVSVAIGIGITKGID